MNGSSSEGYLEDQLKIERRLRALEAAVGTVRNPERPPRSEGGGVLQRLEALEDQVEAMKRGRRGDR